MKKTFTIIIAVFFIYFYYGCKEETTTAPEGNVTISVRYNRPAETYTNGAKTYSSVASISWKGGNTTVANSSQSTNIYVPKDASLTATYSSSTTTISTTGRISTTNNNYSKTLVANGNKSWSL